jgi:Mrr N-terminal domain/SeqA protein N-terminal domain
MRKEGIRMTPTIRIDEELYAYLKEKAEPFVDTPNSVLRRLLKLPGENGSSAEVDSGDNLDAEESPSRNELGGPASPVRAKPRLVKKRGRQRAVRGSLVPQADYELPILQVLVEKGGRAPSREVIDALEPRLADKLKDVDRAKTSSGEIRWRNRAQFVRLDLIEKGQLTKDSPRGIWEITEAGERRAGKG